MDSIESSNGQEDHVKGVYIRGKIEGNFENVQRISSIELLVAAQAFGFRNPRSHQKLS